MGRLIGRLIVVPIGFILAGITAAIVVLFIAQEKLSVAMRDVGGEQVLGFIEPLLKLAVSLFSVQTLLLPLLLIIAGEVARIRHVAYYVVGIGAAFALIPVMAKFGAEDGIGSLTAIWPIFATAGFAGGLMYWLVAGRRA
jgi:uncharacterized membrane protein YuzA (DUF378 family)